MKKHAFLTVVREAINANPEWVADAIAALNAGVIKRLDLEIQKRADAEVAASILAGPRGGAVNKLNEKDRAKVVSALCNSHMFGGTEYAKTLAAKFGKK